MIEVHNFVKNVKMHIFGNKGYGTPPQVDIKNCTPYNDFLKKKSFV